MFDLKKNAKGETVLVYADRYRYPFERGLWVEICHESEKEASKLVDFNKGMGVQVEKDEKGFFRALVLKD